MGSGGSQRMSASVLDLDLFTGAVQSLPANDLAAIRASAASRFAHSGFPTSRDEAWKYTNLSGAAEIANTWLRDNANNAVAETGENVTGDAASLVMESIDACWLVIRNGIVDSSSLSQAQDELGPGLVISPLTDQHNIDIDDPMSAFNAALLRDGLYISIDENANPEKPLGIIQVDHSSLRSSQTRIVMDLAASSCLDVIECVVSDGDDSQFSNAVTQANLATGARLNHVRIQVRNIKHIGVNRFVANLNGDARLRHNTFDFGGALTRNDVVANILGAGADVRLHGLYLASGEQHIDNHTRVEHRVGPAYSQEEYRGILGGKSRCVFNGQAVVFEGADGTDANQANHNLLLSDHAEIDTKPELEIYADDVKCSHGATVGQLDEKSLFYLRTRGLSQDEARNLLTQAFATEILGELSVENCRDYVMEAMTTRLASLVDEGQS
jgi:Fe-S cluster assembly protein SufD